MIKVSVIIPIYGVEAFIKRCALSLFSQTLQDIELIFVNDATRDNSIEILQSLIQQHPKVSDSVKIVSHPKNLGLPAARNTGLKIATGKYIFHCDSDDYIEPNALELLYETAEKEQADIVWCDWYLTFDTKERYMHQPSYHTTEEAMRGILSGAMKYNVWNKLIKHEIYKQNQINFPNGHSMGEDMTMIRLFACAQRVAYIPQALYHYVKTNQEALTNTYSSKHLEDILYNTAETIHFINQQKENKWEKEIEFFKLNVKYPFLISDKKEMYRIWKSWFIESNAFILQNKHQSYRSKLLQYAAWRNQFWIIWLYYKIVYCFIYGVIYK